MTEQIYENANPTNGEFRLLYVRIHHEVEGWWAEAPERLQNWISAGDSYEELAEMLNEAAREYGYNGWYGLMPPDPVMEVDE